MQQIKDKKSNESANRAKKGTDLFIKVLNIHGGRLTEERREMLRTVLNMKGHFDAEEVHETLLKQGCEVSLATVYRNLTLIVDAGIISRVSLSLGDQSRMQFECILNKKHHDHLVCLGCGKNVEFSYPAIEILQDAVALEHGFILTRHSLELLGYCQSCQTLSADNEGTSAHASDVLRLVDLKPKATARIVRLSGGKALINKLHTHGLREGRLIRLVRLGTFGGPLLIEDIDSQSKIMTAKDMAAHVMVQEVNSDD